MSNLNNFDTKKYTNLADYLKLDYEININNVDEVLSNFVVEPHFYKNDDYCALCFCGHKLKNYYYIYNINNGDRLFCGNNCVCIFDKCKRLENGKVNKKLQQSIINKLESGSFEEITNWSEYLEFCLMSYINDIEKYEFNRLLDINKNNPTLLILLNKFWKRKVKNEYVEKQRLIKLQEDKQKQIELEKQRLIAYELEQKKERERLIREEKEQLLKQQLLNEKRNSYQNNLEKIWLEFIKTPQYLSVKNIVKHTKSDWFATTMFKEFKDHINAKIEYYRKLEEKKMN